MMMEDHAFDDVFSNEEGLSLYIYLNFGVTQICPGWLCGATGRGMFNFKHIYVMLISEKLLVLT